MILIEKTDIIGFDHAIRGMRNPMNSWDKSDSGWGGDYSFHVGENDYVLMLKLAKGGSVHGKFRRMITMYVDITAPLYWWKEFDTYKVGTVANSCSTMHKIHAKKLTLDDFSYEHLIDEHDKSYDAALPMHALEATISILNQSRKAFLETEDKKYWWQMIQLLPTSYNQKRTVAMNYEVLANIWKYRRQHKLDEWRYFCSWIDNLPYSEIITCEASEVVE